MRLFLILVMSCFITQCSSVQDDASFDHLLWENYAPDLTICKSTTPAYEEQRNYAIKIRKLDCNKILKAETKKNDREFEEFVSYMKTLNNFDFCNTALNPQGKLNNWEKVSGNLTEPFYLEEMSSRNITNLDCRRLTGKFIDDEERIAEERRAAQKAEEEKIMQRIARRNELKTDCIDLGFKENTEGMGNCVLKLMEIESKNQQAQIINQENEMLEKEKLAVEIAKLEQLIKQAEAAEQAAIAAQQQAKATEAANSSQRFNKALDDIRHWSCYYGNAWDCR